MTRIVSLSLFGLFLLAVTSQISENQASRIVRRDADPEPYFDWPADDTTDDTQNDEENDEDEQAGGDSRPEDIRVLSERMDFEVVLGQTVLLPCEVSSSAPVIQWYKDNQSYTVGNQRTGAPGHVNLDKTNLIINNLKETDVGTYTCSILYPGKEIKPIIHTLKLKAPPKILSLTEAHGGQIVEGEELKITCNATGVPAPSFMWSKEVSEHQNEKLTPDDAEFHDNTMTIRNAKRQHSGTYICYAVNGINNGTADHIRITVLGKPRVSVPKNLINSAPNIEAIMECTVHEQPPAIIRWYKDDKLIMENDSKYVIYTVEQNSTLKVKPENADEFGVFTCEAENSYGKHSQSIMLVQIPVIKTEPTNDTRFVWVVVSHLPVEQIELEIKEAKETNWRKLSIPVPQPRKHHHYHVEYDMNGQGFGPGTYNAILRAKNTAGWSDNKYIQHIKLESEPQTIQHASVYLGGNAVRPATTIFTTFCLYFLTRIL